MFVEYLNGWEHKKGKWWYRFKEVEILRIKAIKCVCKGIYIYVYMHT